MTPHAWLAPAGAAEGVGELPGVNPVYTWCVPRPRSTARAGPPPPRFTRASAPAPALPARLDAGGADAAAATPDCKLPGCARRHNAQVLGRRGGRMHALIIKESMLGLALPRPFFPLPLGDSQRIQPCGRHALWNAMREAASTDVFPALRRAGRAAAPGPGAELAAMYQEPERHSIGPGTASAHSAHPGAAGWPPRQGAPRVLAALRAALRRLEARQPSARVGVRRVML